MTQLTTTVPPMECPDTQLPTPANLSNLFGNIITLAEKALDSEIEELKEEGQKLKDIIQSASRIPPSPLHASRLCVILSIKARWLGG